MGQREFGVSLEHQGTVYNLTPEDFTAIDDLEVEKAVGKSLTRVFYGLASGDPSLSGLAALVWRYRVNNGEDDLTFLAVARTFNFADVKTVRPELRDDADPKASADS